MDPDSPEPPLESVRGKHRRLRVTLPAVLSVAAGPERAFAAPETTSNPGEIETLSLVDPEATVVRRRTELLGQPELATRGTQEVKTAADLVDAIAKRPSP